MRLLSALALAQDEILPESAKDDPLRQEVWAAYQANQAAVDHLAEVGGSDAQAVVWAARGRLTRAWDALRERDSVAP